MNGGVNGGMIQSINEASSNETIQQKGRTSSARKKQWHFFHFHAGEGFNKKRREEKGERKRGKEKRRKGKERRERRRKDANFVVIRRCSALMYLARQLKSSILCFYELDLTKKRLFFRCATIISRS
jgi:hypothetical protein